MNLLEISYWKAIQYELTSLIYIYHVPIYSIVVFDMQIFQSNFRNILSEYFCERRKREKFFFRMCMIEISGDSNQNRTNVRCLWAKYISEAIMRVIILKQNINMRTFLFCDISNFQINRPNLASRIFVFSSRKHF